MNPFDPKTISPYCSRPEALVRIWWQMSLEERETSLLLMNAKKLITQWNIDPTKDLPNE